MGMYLSPEARFWSFVIVDDGNDGCWPWGGSTSRGYGQFGAGGTKVVKAHRFAYELFVGPIPEGLQLDHLCRVRHCVNPSHLEPVTQAENLRRARAAGHAPQPGGPCVA